MFVKKAESLYADYEKEMKARKKQDEILMEQIDEMKVTGSSPLEKMNSMLG